jgi:Tol biopolymer transport system component
MKMRTLGVTLFLVVAVMVLASALKDDTEDPTEVVKEPPSEIPEGILVDEIPEDADIIFVSMRYVFNDLAFLDEDYEIKSNFLNDPECIQMIYNAESNVLASPRQLYALDVETGDVTMLTNVEYDFSSSKPVDSTRIMAIGASNDTDGDGIISTKDEINIFLVDFAEEEIECLTSEINITSINNPDYSTVNGKILFSAQWKGRFHNYLFTLDLEGNLEQITDDEDYLDFDCSWSEDGSKIVFSRLPKQDFPFLIPSQVWLMDADGSNMMKITDGGPNTDDEEPHGNYPIGIDADPDLSPDNSKIVFSRLKTGKENEPFGVYELVIVDVGTREETVLDSDYANMIPEWKHQGIVFIRQVGSTGGAMDLKQSAYETEPYDVFPIGSNGASWID